MASDRRIWGNPPVAWSWGMVLTQGALGGVIAGIVMLVGEMAQAAIMGEPLLAPATMIGAMLLGPEVIGDLSLPVIGTGMMWHLVLSALFGVIFAAVAVAWPFLGRSATNLAIAGIVYGTALWLVNFFVIGQTVGWTWFAEMTNPVAQVVVHAFFFGLPLGVYLGTRARASEAGVQDEELRREAA